MVDIFLVIRSLYKYSCDFKQFMEDTGIDSKLRSELSEISNSDKCDRTASHRSTTTTHHLQPQPPPPRPRPPPLPPPTTTWRQQQQRWRWAGRWQGRQRRR